MDLNAIIILERLKYLRALRLEEPKLKGPLYKLRKQENVIRIFENIKMVNDIKQLLKYINRMQPIKIPINSEMAQGAKISGSVLPSGLKMYNNIDNYEWVIRGNFAVLEDQIG